MPHLHRSAPFAYNVLGAFVRLALLSSRLQLSSRMRNSMVSNRNRWQPVRPSGHGGAILIEGGAPSRPGINHHLHGVRRDGLLNRGVGVVQAVAVRDELADRILSHVPGELAHTR